MFPIGSQSSESSWRPSPVYATELNKMSGGISIESSSGTITINSQPNLSRQSEPKSFIFGHSQSSPDKNAEALTLTVPPLSSSSSLRSPAVVGGNSLLRPPDLLPHFAEVMFWIKIDSFVDSSREIILRAFAKEQLSWKTDFQQGALHGKADPGIKCLLYCAKILISRGEGVDAKAAEVDAFEDFLERVVSSDFLSIDSNARITKLLLFENEVEVIDDGRPAFRYDLLCEDHRLSHNQLPSCSVCKQRGHNQHFCRFSLINAKNYQANLPSKPTLKILKTSEQSVKSKPLKLDSMSRGHVAASFKPMVTDSVASLPSTSKELIPKFSPSPAAVPPSGVSYSVSTSLFDLQSIKTISSNSVTLTNLQKSRASVEETTEPLQFMSQSVPLQISASFSRSQAPPVSSFSGSINSDFQILSEPHSGSAPIHVQSLQTLLTPLPLKPNQNQVPPFQPFVTPGPVPPLGPISGPLPSLGPTHRPVPPLESTPRPVPYLGLTPRPVPPVGSPSALIPPMVPPPIPVPPLAPPPMPVASLGPPPMPIPTLGLQPRLVSSAIGLPPRPVTPLGLPTMNVPSLGQPPRPVPPPLRFPPVNVPSLGQPPRPVPPPPLGLPPMNVPSFGQLPSPVPSLGQPPKLVASLGQTPRPVPSLGKPLRPVLPPGMNFPQAVQSRPPISKTLQLGQTLTGSTESEPRHLQAPQTGPQSHSAHSGSSFSPVGQLKQSGFIFHQATSVPAPEGEKLQLSHTAPLQTAVKNAVMDETTSISSAKRLSKLKGSPAPSLDSSDVSGRRSPVFSDSSDSSIGFGKNVRVREKVTSSHRRSGERSRSTERSRSPTSRGRSTRERGTRPRDREKERDQRGGYRARDRGFQPRYAEDAGKDFTKAKDRATERHRWKDTDRSRSRSRERKSSRSEKERAERSDRREDGKSGGKVERKSSGKDEAADREKEKKRVEANAEKKSVEKEKLEPGSKNAAGKTEVHNRKSDGKNEKSAVRKLNTESAKSKTQAATKSESTALSKPKVEDKFSRAFAQMGSSVDKVSLIHSYLSQLAKEGGKMIDVATRRLAEAVPLDEQVTLFSTVLITLESESDEEREIVYRSFLESTSGDISWDLFKNLCRIVFDKTHPTELAFRLDLKLSKKVGPLLAAGFASVDSRHQVWSSQYLAKLSKKLVGAATKYFVDLASLSSPEERSARIKGDVNIEEGPKLETKLLKDETIDFRLDNLLFNCNVNVPKLSSRTTKRFMAKILSSFIVGGCERQDVLRLFKSLHKNDPGSRRPIYEALAEHLPNAGAVLNAEWGSSQLNKLLSNLERPLDDPTMDPFVEKECVVNDIFHEIGSDFKVLEIRSFDECLTAEDSLMHAKTIVVWAKQRMDWPLGNSEKGLVLAIMEKRVCIVYQSCINSFRTQERVAVRLLPLLNSASSEKKVILSKETDIHTLAPLMEIPDFLTMCSYIGTHMHKQHKMSLRSNLVSVCHRMTDGEYCPRGSVVPWDLPLLGVVRRHLCIRAVMLGQWALSDPRFLEKGVEKTGRKHLEKLWAEFTEKK